MKTIDFPFAQRQRVELALALAALDVRQQVSSDSLVDGDLEAMREAGLVQTSDVQTTELTPEGLDWIRRRALTALIDEQL